MTPVQGGPHRLLPCGQIATATDKQIAEDDLVVLRWSLTGTHRGEFLGIPPTGNAVTLRGIDMYRVRDGRIAEHWNVVDMFGFCQQLGALPSPAR